MTAVLEAAGLSVERGGRVVATADAVAVGEGETLAVLGPNGAGKTSLLLALATLIPSRGDLRHRGAPIADPIAFRRRSAVVFQRPLLLDRSVRDNAALGLEIRGVPLSERRVRALAALERFGVAQLADRSAVALSGGEAQRVSLARAFAVEPELLLLDEPFSGLDEATRGQLLDDLAGALQETGVTTVFVTHDRAEALRLADRVAVLIGGRLRQAGSAAVVFGAPVDEEVAAFVGVETIVAGRVVEVRDGLATVAVGGQRLTALAPPHAGENVRVCIRPEDVVIQLPKAEAPASSARNLLLGTVTEVRPRGPEARVVIDCGFALVATVTRLSVEEMGLAPGARVAASIKATALHLLPGH